MTSDLRIDRLAVRTHVGGDAASWRERIDRVASVGLRGDLERAWPAVAASLGIAPEAEVLIRRVGLRLRLDEEVDDVAIAEGWARAILDGLGAVAERAPLGEPAIGKDVAVFRDRAALEVRYVADRARGAPIAWWWAVAFGSPRAGLPEAAAVIGRWIEDEPEQVPARVVALVDACVPIDGLVVDDAAAVALAARLQEVRALANASAGAAGAWASADEPDLFAVLARRLPATSRQLLRGAQSLPKAHFVAVCLAAAWTPAAARWSMRDTERLVAWSRPAAPPAASVEWREPGTRVDGASRPPAVDPPVLPRTEEPGRQATISRPLGSPPADDTTEAVPPETEPSLARPEWDLPQAAPPRERHEVGSGGVLFLLRSALAHPGPDRGAVARERLLMHVAIAALQRVTAPLPTAERRAARLRDAALVRVFCGSDELPEPFADAVPDAEAVDRLDEIVARVPPDLPLDVAGVRATFAASSPFGPGHADRPLAALALRAGVLFVDRTHADLYLPLASVDLTLRLGGWDIDPGWVPAVGRVVRFHYVERLP